MSLNVLAYPKEAKPLSRRIIYLAFSFNRTKLSVGFENGLKIIDVDSSNIDFEKDGKLPVQIIDFFDEDDDENIALYERVLPQTPLKGKGNKTRKREDAKTTGVPSHQQPSLFTSDDTTNIPTDSIRETKSIVSPDDKSLKVQAAIEINEREPEISLPTLDVPLNPPTIFPPKHFVPAKPPEIFKSTVIINPSRSNSVNEENITDPHFQNQQLTEFYHDELAANDVHNNQTHLSPRQENVISGDVSSPLLVETSKQEAAESPVQVDNSILPLSNASSDNGSNDRSEMLVTGELKNIHAIVEEKISKTSNFDNANGDINSTISSIQKIPDLAKSTSSTAAAAATTTTTTTTTTNTNTTTTAALKEIKPSHVVTTKLSKENQMTIESCVFRVVFWSLRLNQLTKEICLDREPMGIKIHKQFVAIVLLEKIFIVNQKGKLVRILKTFKNPLGICAISTQKEPAIAFPDIERGSVQIFRLNLLKSITIRAHDNEITAIALTPKADYVATASSKGTLIRVFDSSLGNTIKEFRRGAKPSIIYSLAFNETGDFVCCTSSSGTIHLFDVLRDEGASNALLESFSIANEHSVAKYKGVQGLSVCCFSPMSDRIVFVATTQGKLIKLDFGNFKHGVKVISTFEFAKQ